MELRSADKSRPQLNRESAHAEIGSMMRALAAKSSPGLTSAVQGTHRGDGAFNCNWYTEEKIGHHNIHGQGKPLALTTNHRKLESPVHRDLFTSALKVEVPVASILNPTHAATATV